MTPLYYPCDGYGFGKDKSNNFGEVFLHSFQFEIDTWNCANHSIEGKMVQWAVFVLVWYGPQRVAGMLLQEEPSALSDALPSKVIEETETKRWGIGLEK